MTAAEDCVWRPPEAEAAPHERVHFRMDVQVQAPAKVLRQSCYVKVFCLGEQDRVRARVGMEWLEEEDGRLSIVMLCDSPDEGISIRKGQAVARCQLLMKSGHTVIPVRLAGGGDGEGKMPQVDGTKGTLAKFYLSDPPAHIKCKDLLCLDLPGGLAWTLRHPCVSGRDDEGFFIMAMLSTLQMDFCQRKRKESSAVAYYVGPKETSAAECNTQRAKLQMLNAAPLPKPAAAQGCSSLDTRIPCGCPMYDLEVPKEIGVEGINGSSRMFFLKVGIRGAPSWAVRSGVFAKVFPLASGDDLGCVARGGLQRLLETGRCELVIPMKTRRVLRSNTDSPGSLSFSLRAGTVVAKCQLMKDLLHPWDVHRFSLVALKEASLGSDVEGAPVLPFRLNSKGAASWEQQQQQQQQQQ